jgi:hypothetical protein
MSEKAKDREEAVPLWRALARLAGGNWADAAYGFGGPEIAEAVGTAEEVGAELTRILNSLELENVEAERLRTGHFAVLVEVEPLDDGLGTLAGPPGDLPAVNPVPLWEASAGAGNGRGVFDACYSYGNSQGDEGHLLGTASELGAELTRVLKKLTRGDVQTMRYGTERFFLQLLIELPHKD